MRPKDFSGGKVPKRFKRAKRRFRMMPTENAKNGAQLICYLRVRAARKILFFVEVRSTETSLARFNLNI